MTNCAAATLAGPDFGAAAATSGATSRSAWFKA